jgi:hypothetical protein
MNIQLADHDNDTDDIPEKVDPMELIAKHQRGKEFLTEGELIEQKEDEKMEVTAEEIHDMKEGISDNNLVQYANTRIPHENDTDDVETANVDFGYNHMHSKAWNQEVNKKAEELENEIKIQENLKISQKKAQEDAKVKAEQERIRKAEERRKQLEEEQKKRALGSGPNHKTINLGELYGGIEDIDMVQLSSKYERHSKFFQHEMDVAQAEMDKQDKDEAENEAYGLYQSKAERAASTPKTIDTEELYDNIAVQTEAR